MRYLGTIRHISRCSSSKTLEDALSRYYKKNQPLPGYCNEQSTLSFSKLDSNIHASHWRQPKFIPDKVKISSLGLGTQSGDLQAQTDLKMFSTILHGLKSGRINLLDTDINFRYGKSQKLINACLNHLHHDHKISRSSIFISTKCGYIPHDIDSNLDDKQFLKIMIEEGYITADDVVNEVHCLHPNFVKFCAEKSCLSLGVDTIDLLYLNNPVESQQTVIGKDLFMDRLKLAFQALEELRTLNKIRYYGIASFISFRSPPNEEGIHADLNEMVEIAQKVGGKSHGLRFVLVPFNLGMPEILTRWQISKSKAEQTLFKIAEQCQVNLNFCCPLYQGRVANIPFQSKLLNNLSHNSAKHLQLIRSLPKDVVMSTIFSTLNMEHLEQNLTTAECAYLTQQQWKQVLPFK